MGWGGGGARRATVAVAATRGAVVSKAPGTAVAAGSTAAAERTEWVAARVGAQAAAARKVEKLVVVLAMEAAGAAVPVAVSKEVLDRCHTSEGKWR